MSWLSFAKKWYPNSLAGFETQALEGGHNLKEIRLEEKAFFWNLIYIHICRVQNLQKGSINQII